MRALRPLVGTRLAAVEWPRAGRAGAGNPHASGSDAERESAASSSRDRTAVSRVLVVDDDPTVREVVVSYLRAEHYEVDEVADGESALSQVGHSRPDLVVLDVLLPGLDGLEVCRRIRGSTDIPIILLSALGSETDRVVGLEFGADDYLTKPFSPRELMLRVGSVLRRWRAAPWMGSAARREPRDRHRKSTRHPRRQGAGADLARARPADVLHLQSRPSVLPRGSAAQRLGLVVRRPLDRHCACPTPPREGGARPLPAGADRNGVGSRLSMESGIMRRLSRPS